jgi:hypothetical protein
MLPHIFRAITQDRPYITWGNGANGVYVNTGRIVTKGELQFAPTLLSKS